MTYEAIITFLEAAPFRQFTLTTSAGKTYRITHPDFVGFTPSHRIIWIYTDGDLFDALDVEMITEINHTGPRPQLKVGRKRAG